MASLTRGITFFFKHLRKIVQFLKRLETPTRDVENQKFFNDFYEQSILIYVHFARK